MRSGMSRSIVERGKGRRCQEKWKQMQLLQHTEESERVMKSGLDTITAGLDTRFQQFECLHKTLGFLLETERLMIDDAIDLDDLQPCRGNVQILRQHSQTTSTMLVLWMKYKTVEFLSADVQELPQHLLVSSSSLCHLVELTYFPT